MKLRLTYNEMRESIVESSGIGLSPPKIVSLDNL